MCKISTNTIIQKNKQIVSADMDGETVMMNIQTGKYYNLGNMGGGIWALIEGQTKVETIIESLMEEYNVTREQCEKEVLSFLNQILGQGLIECVE